MRHLNCAGKLDPSHLPAAQGRFELFKAGACQTMSRERRSWGRVKAELVRRTGLAREETSFASPQHTFLLNLKGNADRGEYFLDGRLAPFVPRKVGSILFIPQDAIGKDGKSVPPRLPIFLFP